MCLDQTPMRGAKWVLPTFSKVCSTVLQFKVCRGQPLDSLAMLCWGRLMLKKTS